MDDLLRELTRIARSGGDRLLPLWGRIETREVGRKGPVDLVTRADLEVEELIKGELARVFPGISFLGEETNPDAALTGEVWLVDPLDGTTNFIHGHPFYCISIALARDGEVDAGIIFAPALRELFAGGRGGGAWLNGSPLRVSAVNDLNDALLATGFACQRRPGGTTNIPAFAYLLDRTQGIRRAGSAALDLAYVAAGRIDAYWEFNLGPWDVAAGSLMVEEAGGTVTDSEGNRAFLRGRSIVASNGELHQEITGALRQIPISGGRGRSG